MYKRGEAIEQGLAHYNAEIQKHTVQKHRQNIAIAIAMISFGVVIIAAGFGELGQESIAIVLLILGGIGTIAGGIGVYYNKTDDLEWQNVQLYKKDIIQPLIEECFEGAIFEPCYDSSNIKMEVQIFTKAHKYADYEIKDCIRASVDGITFIQMELLHILYRPRMSNKIYFKGTLYDIVWDKAVSSDIIICANRFSLLSKYVKKKELILIEGFGKPEGVLVYSNDKSDVETILTPERIHRMKAFFALVQKPIVIRITNGHIYSMLQGIYDVFEPSISNALDYDAVRSKVFFNLGLTKRLLQAFCLYE